MGEKGLNKKFFFDIDPYKLSFSDITGKEDFGLSSVVYKSAEEVEEAMKSIIMQKTGKKEGEDPDDYIFPSVDVCDGKITELIIPVNKCKAEKIHPKLAGISNIYVINFNKKGDIISLQASGDESMKNLEKFHPYLEGISGINFCKLENGELAIQAAKVLKMYRGFEEGEQDFVLEGDLSKFSPFLKGISNVFSVNIESKSKKIIFIAGPDPDIIPIKGDLSTIDPCLEKFNNKANYISWDKEKKEWYVIDLKDSEYWVKPVNKR